MKFAAIVFSLAVLSQSGTQNAAVSGDVRDSTGGVVPGAQVVLTSQSTAAASTAVTNARGQYRFQNLAAGSYQLAVTIAGFRTARRLVNTTEGSTVTANFDLQLGVLSEAVTVVAAGTGRVNDPMPAMAPSRAAPSSVTAESPVRPQVDPSLPVRVGGNIEEPRKLRHVPPSYPADAQAAGVTGVVILEATVGVDGSVQGIRLVKGVPASPSLDESAIAAVKQWRYTPTKLNGVATEVALTVTASFQLR